MSLKRPLSPESNINFINNTVCQLKLLKLRSILQELRNEEAYLVLLKKLRTNQQLLTQTNNNNTKTVTNGCHPIEKPIITPSIKPVQLPITTKPLQQQSLPITTRKTSNSPLLTNSNKTSKNSSFEEYKTQAKLALRKQLERDLLNISLPKPSIQDTIFIPNGTSAEFQLYLGLEDVIQCFNELQSSRHRLPQRFTDHAYIDEPHICDQCGTDFTIRWWKHINSKISNQIITILCDRCKKQITRRTSKSDHSTLLKSVFISAMEKEKEIDKHFNALMKQQKTSSRSSSSSLSSTSKPLTTNIPSTNHQNHIIKTKNFLSQNFPSKTSQQSTPTIRKSNVIVQSHIKHPTLKHDNHSRTVQHNRISMPIHYHHQQQQQQQQQSRSITNLSQQTKINQTVKISKNSMKRQPIMSPSRSILPPNPDLINSLLSSNLVRPTTTKRSTFSTVEKK
ncbi:unnamed protein product [Rotaria sp. Silwood2]|nr:unnamed protein product [Rotaria sp. Silwood2]CAF2585137.1 unnamed protein product [Rotaria sp. Silwood2]CAF2997323.1 unnamed protein product [Rotaria sp. Silwood2]CAF4050864.1 unnamed protein product [Rotaria sp. Silwood2]CAF4076335.1 unnamed protein product [Rotaria sp. Silwood2]